VPRKLFPALASCAITAALFSAPLLTRAHAQEQAAPPAALPSQLIANLEKLRAAALSSDYAWKELAHLTENIGPRLTGSPQATEAANYVAGEMRQLGLDVKLEKTMVPHWVRGEERAELTVYPGQAPHTTQRIVLTALGNSPATPPDGLSAEVVVVNNFDELTALGREKVAGRIVLFNEMYDKQLAAAGMSFPAYGAAVQYRVLGAQAAAKLGAVAVLVRSVGDADYR
jgi:carboxypeptidase Q